MFVLYHDSRVTFFSFFFTKFQLSALSTVYWLKKIQITSLAHTWSF